MSRRPPRCRAPSPLPRIPRQGSTTPHSRSSSQTIGMGSCSARPSGRRRSAITVSTTGSATTREQASPSRTRGATGCSSARARCPPRASRRAIATWIDNAIANLRDGMASGRVATRESVRRTSEQFDQSLAESVDQWPLLDPLKQTHPDWSDADRQQFAADLSAAVKDGVAPGYARYRDALRDEVLPKTRSEDHAGMVWLPDGDACYAATVRQHTTTDRTAEQIHALGLQEIARIDGEISALGEKVFGTRDLPTILARLRTDKSLYFKSSDEVQAAAEQALADAKAKIPDWFGILPQADCTVVPVPDYEAPFTTIAYYQQPAPDVGRPGQYNINLYAPETRPRFEARVLAYHESIPGHHLQIAIAQERSELPAFRRHEGFTAFVEGWALYT